MITTELNGTIADFGTKFWALVEQEASGFLTDFTQQAVCSLTYSDRYLASPLTVALFSELVKSMPFTVNGDCTLSLHILKAKAESATVRRIYSNWHLDEDTKRESFISAMLWDVTRNCDVMMYDHSKKVGHARTMKITFSNGKHLIFRLDQGVGYWSNDTNPHPTFPFASSVADQLIWIEHNLANIRIRNGAAEPTYVFVKKP